MLEQIEFGNFREASWNYIAPSKSQVLEWIMLAWEGPESKVTEKALLKGIKLCYMGAYLDEKVSKWDRYKKNEDYDAYDWKEEVKSLSETERRNLFVSPLAWEITSCDEEDSEETED